MEPARFTNLWISAYRKLNDSEFAALTYENNVQAGWIQHFRPDVWLKTQGGWIGGTVASQQAPFHGTFAASTFAYGLRGGMTASISAQYGGWAGVANVTPNRTLFMVGLYWSPNGAEPDNLTDLWRGD